MGRLDYLQYNVNRGDLVQHLFQSWESFSSDIKGASHILLLSDYDGTLTPIVSRLEEAILPTTVREKLRTLAKNQPSLWVLLAGAHSQKLTLWWE